MMTLIEQFTKKALEDNLDSFVIKVPKDNKEKGNMTYYFVQSQIGKAKYIYGNKDYWDENSYNAIDCKIELTAIVSDSKVYIVDEYKLEVPHYVSPELPDNVFYFYQKKGEINEFVENEIFRPFFKKLKIVDIDSTPALEKKARKILLSGNKCVEKPRYASCFNEKDIADILCGFIDIQLEAEKRLQKDEDEWTYLASKNEKLDFLICNPDEDVAEPWEIEIADALNSVDAKTVTVEFLLNGKSASAKINPQKILKNLSEKDCFSHWDFITSVSGEKLLETLGATDSWFSNDQPMIKCEHITKITYGKKVLYSDV